jgi:hypothetical protein
VDSANSNRAPDEPNHRWFRVAVRAIRGVVSIACLLACVGFAALWVRSYYSHDTLCRWSGSDWHVGAWSLDGQITHTALRRAFNGGMPVAPWTWTRRPTAVQRLLAGGQPSEVPTLLGFGYSRLRNRGYTFIVPHWFLVAMTGTLAVAVKPTPRLRFSVRDLLVAMTMVAVVVAALAALPMS